MKLFAKLMIVGLFIAMALPFTVLKDKDGNTLMSFSDLELPDFSLPDLPSLPDTDKVLPAVDSLSGKDIIYEWRDAAGNIQFSTEPPPAGVEYSMKGYDPNTNVIQSVKLPKDDAESVVIEFDGDAPADGQKIGNPYSPEAVDKLFEDAKNIEKLLNERMKQQESALNQ